MSRQKRWISFILVILSLSAFTFSATAGSTQVNDTITIDSIVGDNMYYEFYMDNNADIDGGFIAKRDGGTYPDWSGFIFNSDNDGINPRTAYISLKAEKAGEWSFRAGIFETPNMSKKQNRLYTAQVNLRIRFANEG